MKSNGIFTSSVWPILVTASFLILGCKSAPVKTAADFTTLMSEGNCAEIKKRITGDSLSAQERGALATCLLVAAQDPSHKKDAAQLISHEFAATAAANGIAFLGLATLYPNPQRAFELAVYEVAFAIGGYGPLGTQPSVAPETIDAQKMVIAILQFTKLSYLEGATANTADVSEIWKGCQHLLNHSYAATDEYVAWSLHTSLAAVALRMWDPLNKTDLSYDLMRATVAVVEQNQTISVAARCDLAAPYDQLKMALSKDTALLGRLERAVSAAMGCSRGKYAPQKN